MIDARTLLLAEQARRAEGNHATANLLRETASTITSLRTALRLARAAVEADRQDHFRGVTKMVPSDEEIRQVFLDHGFTTKPGCDDLKPYVYAAARALLSRYNSSQPAASPEPVPDIPVGCEMTRNWSVTVCAEGADILTISSEYVAGVSDLEPWRSTIRGCAQHLLSFVGDAAPVAQEPVVMKEICPECGHQFACFHNPYINQLRAAPVAAQAQPTGYEEAGSFIWDGDEWRMAAAKYGEDPDVVTLYKRVNAQYEPQQSGISGELPTAQDREDAFDMEAAAKAFAESMDYPWEPMPEKGREAMRKLAKRVIDAARAAKGDNT